MTSNASKRSAESPKPSDPADQPLSIRRSIEYTPLPTQLLYTSTIKVLVGLNKKEFVVHKGLLISESDYFRAAFDGGFAEARAGVVHLVDEDPVIFTLFVTWLYSGKLVRPKDEKDGPLIFRELIDLYIFGDRRIIINLKNACINKIFRCIHLGGWNVICYLAYVYEETPRRCTLQRLLVDTRWQYSYISQDRNWIPMEYNADLLNSVGVWRGLPYGSKPRHLRPGACFYHEKRVDGSHDCPGDLNDKPEPGMDYDVNREAEGWLQQMELMELKSRREFRKAQADRQCSNLPSCMSTLALSTSPSKGNRACRDQISLYGSALTTPTRRSSLAPITPPGLDQWVAPGFARTFYVMKETSRCSARSSVIRPGSTRRFETASENPLHATPTATSSSTRAPTALPLDCQRRGPGFNNFVRAVSTAVRTSTRRPIIPLLNTHRLGQSYEDDSPIDITADWTDPSSKATQSSSSHHRPPRLFQDAASSQRADDQIDGSISPNTGVFSSTTYTSRTNYQTTTTASPPTARTATSTPPIPFISQRYDTQRPCDGRHLFEELCSQAHRGGTIPWPGVAAGRKRKEWSDDAAPTVTVARKRLRIGKTKATKRARRAKAGDTPAWVQFAGEWITAKQWVRYLVCRIGTLTALRTARALNGRWRVLDTVEGVS